MLKPDESSSRIPMRDLGRFALAAVAPLIARLGRDKGEDTAATLADIRDLAIYRGEDGDDVIGASVCRTFGWMVWTMGAVLVYAVASMARGPFAPLVILLEGIMIVAISVGMFAGGMALMSALRQLWARVIEGEVNSRLMWTKDRPVPPRNPGLLVRSALPTNFDVVPALLFAYGFVPHLLPA